MTESDISGQSLEFPRLHSVWRNAESICIKCGFCLPVCPTYRETGNEAASPRGRLDLLYAAAQGVLKVADIKQEISLCLGCLACETACPSAIRFGDLLEAAYSDLTAKGRGRRGHGSFLRELLLDKILLSPFLLKVVFWKLFLYQRSGFSSLVRALRVLELVFPALAKLERNMPPIPLPALWTKSWSKSWSKNRQKTGPDADAPPPAALSLDRGRVVLFSGCIMNILFAPVHQATVKVLACNGIRCDVSAGQTCCGALHLHSGEREKARRLARENITAFERTEMAGSPPILVNAAGCGAQLKDYGRLLEDDPEWRDRAAGFAARVMDISEYLIGLKLTPPSHRVNLKVAYDDPCHLLHAQKIKDQPRKLLGLIPGLEIAPLPEADWCCGSAGSFSLTQPGMAEKVLARKMEHIAASGAEVVATGNPGCLLNIRMGARARGMKIEVVHPIELLARAYG